MVFVFVMTWYGHVVRNTLSAINLNNQAFNLVRPLEAGRHWLSLFPHCVWIQFRYWGSFCDMFIKDGGDVRLSYLGIPGIVGIDDDRRPLLAGTGQPVALTNTSPGGTDRCISPILKAISSCAAPADPQEGFGWPGGRELVQTRI
jgi:hypothetical protein